MINMKLALTLLVFCCFILVSVSAFRKMQNKESGGKAPAQTIQSTEEKLSTSQSRFLLPQLPPHPDTCYLLEFVVPETEKVNRVKPTVKKLEENFNTKVRVIDITKKPEYYKIFDLVGGNEKGVIPFFYNRRTSTATTGVTPYFNLKLLAKGSTSCELRIEEKDINDEKDASQMVQRSYGASGKLIEKVFMAFSGEGKMRREKKEKKSFLDNFKSS